MKTLYAVRTSFDDPAGAITHETLFGTDPTVFSNRDDAEKHAQKLAADAAADGGFWRNNRPAYFVEAITADEMYPAEEIAQ